MRISVRNAESSWAGFLREIDKKKAQLHCSESGAWYRGQKDKKFHLIPSSLRTGSRSQAVTADVTAAQRSIQADIQEAKSRKGKLGREIDHIRKELRKMNDRKGAEARGLRSELKGLHQESIQLSKRLDSNRSRSDTLGSIHPGEYDAFVEFDFRSGREETSSWSTLGKMRHYGVHTRLLDWTEAFYTALYFALEYSIDREKGRAKEQMDPKKAYGITRVGDFFVIPGNFPIPCLWILNPYKLAENSLGERRIWDPGLAPHLDYFRAFFVDHDWPFAGAIPMYAPWRNPRLSAQQGMFTLHGKDRAALNHQVSTEVVDKIELTPGCAAFAVDHIRKMGMDRFSLYRDLESLAGIVNRKYFEKKGL